MKCSKCGKKVPENDMFCLHCGAILYKQKQDTPVVQKTVVFNNPAPPINNSPQMTNQKTTPQRNPASTTKVVLCVYLIIVAVGILFFLLSSNIDSDRYNKTYTDSEKPTESVYDKALALELMEPIENFNNALATKDGELYKKVFPDFALNTYLSLYELDSLDEYASMRYEYLVDTYGEDIHITDSFEHYEKFTISEINEFRDEMETFYDVRVSSIDVYLIVTESDFTYLDKNGVKTTDTYTEPYIVYKHSGTWYIEYDVYVSTYLANNGYID